MNNDLYRVQDKTGDEQNPQIEETRLAVALSKIVKNRDWKIIVEQYFGPRLAGARRRADEGDAPDLYRAQGEIKILKELSNLEKAFVAQQNTIDHANEEITIGDDEGF